MTAVLTLDAYRQQYGFAQPQPQPNVMPRILQPGQPQVSVMPTGPQFGFTPPFVQARPLVPGSDLPIDSTKNQQRIDKFVENIPPGTNIISGVVSIPISGLAAFAAAAPEQVRPFIVAAQQQAQNVANFVGAGERGVQSIGQNPQTQQAFQQFVSTVPGVLEEVTRQLPQLAAAGGSVVSLTSDVAGWLAGPAASIPYVGGAASAVLNVYAPLAKVVGGVVSAAGSAAGIAGGMTGAFQPPRSF